MKGVCAIELRYADQAVASLTECYRVKRLNHRHLIYSKVNWKT